MSLAVSNDVYDSQSAGVCLRLFGLSCRLASGGVIAANLLLMLSAKPSGCTSDFRLVLPFGIHVRLKLVPQHHLFMSFCHDMSRTQKLSACLQFEHDPEAFGVNTVPNPPTDFERESASSEVDDSASEASCESSRPSSLHRRTRPVPNKMRQQLRRAVLLAAATASIVTLAKRK